MNNTIKPLFEKEEINTSRQFEFDMAKAVCILGMVFVHCFEELAADTVSEESAAYYIMVIVLDCIFGAGTFMTCMGMGIAYSKGGDADFLIKRGIKIFAFGYLLNLVREGIPHAILSIFGKSTITQAITLTLCNDIMPFAGLALLLFGLLKKMKFSDGMMLAAAAAMSALGWVTRFTDLGQTYVNELAGLFIGTVDSADPDMVACFPLLHWFIVVVVGYLYGKLLRRCRDMNRYYAISFPLSAAILAVYMIIAIPRGAGMMNEDITYFYQFTTPNILILLLGAVFATGLYHFVSMGFSEKMKRIITRISSNINRIYCIHWVMIGWISVIFILTDFDGLNDVLAFVLGVIIYAAANILAEIYSRHLEQKKQLKENR